MTLKIVAFDTPAFGTESADIMRRTAPDATVSLPTQQTLADEMSDADVFFGYHHPDIFGGAAKLKWIQLSSAGVDHILTPELVGRKLLISNASGVHSPQVSEMAWALTLSIARRLPQYAEGQRNHMWMGAVAPLDLAESVVGIIGLGGIGRHYARIANAFGMRIIAIDEHNPSKPDYVEALWKLDQLDEMLRISDVVLIACPYTPKTHHLLDGARIARMKSDAILINIARGGIIDEGALVKHLHNGHLGGAGIDVCEGEPISAESPLWSAPRLVITPHCAGVSAHRETRLIKFFCQNLRLFLARLPLVNLVDQSRGYPVPG